MISRNVIINAAREVGFDLVGVTMATPLVEERKFFDEWLLSGNHSTLEYLERNGDKRFDAGALVEGCRSVIVCAVSYLSEYSRGYDDCCDTKIASYALARDYHHTIKDMLFDLATRLKTLSPDMRCRAFTDSAPISEKSYAIRAGLGWRGRNSLLVTPDYGSMVLLGELVISEVVDEYDVPMEGVGCGECRRCVEACPNGAISEFRYVDTRRCISCRTIEREGCGAAVDLDGWIFGCDACQTVCPYNMRAPIHKNSAFDPLFDPTKLNADAWLSMSEDEFKAMASSTPMPRAGLERIKRNISTRK